MDNYMFDTNIFNAILDGDIDISALQPKGSFFATHIQRDELQATRREERRAQLLSTFHDIPKQSVPTESAAWDVSEWDEAGWGSEDNLCKSIEARLEELKPGDRGNEKDALIAETAIINNYILVTNDPRLRDTTNQFGGQAITLDELLRD